MTSKGTEGVLQSRRPTKALFFVPFGGWLIHNQFDAVVASALRLRGAEVLIVGCDGAFYEKCYVLAHSKNPKHDCANCSGSGQRFFQAFGLPITQIRDWMDPPDEQEALRWAGQLEPSDYASAMYGELPVGKWVTPHLCSYFRITARGLDAPHVQRTHALYLSYALRTYLAMKRLFDSYQPTNVIMFSGNGFLQSPVYHLAEERSIPRLCHEKGFKDGSFVAHSDKPSFSLQPQFELADAWSEVPLVHCELEMVRTYYVNREHGKDLSNMKGFYSFTTDHSVVRRTLAIPEDATIFAVFTSSEYELAYQGQYHQTSKQLAMIDTLFELFRNRKEYLIVRHHPQIGGGGIGNPDYDFLTRAYEQAARAPENVRVIMPHEKLTAYALLWHVDACIAGISTVGIEATARGIPTAALDWIPFSRGTSHVVTDTTKEGLNELVNELLEHVSSFGVEDLRRLYRFTYSLVSRYGYLFSSFEATSDGLPKINVNLLEELREGIDQTLDRFCNHIIKGTSLMCLPDTADLARDTGDENRYFTEEMRRIREMRKQARSSSALAVVDLPSTLSLISCRSFTLPGSQLTRTQVPSRVQASEVRSLIFSPEQSVEERLSQLLGAVELCGNEIISIQPEHYQYDESMLSSSLALLKGEPDLDGIAWGLWLTDEKAKICGQLFTERHPAKLYEDAQSTYPDIEAPEILLGRMLLRRSCLVRVLRTMLQGLRGIQNPTARLFEALSQTRIQESRIPMIVAPPAKKISAVCDFETIGAKSTNSKSRTSDAEDSLTIETGSNTQNYGEMLELAVQCLNESKNTEALKILNQVILVESSIPDAHLAKAIAQIGLSQNEEAASSLQRVLELAPRHPLAEQLLGHLQYRK